MKKLIVLLSIAGAATATVDAASPALTIYNQDFAVVRDAVHLDLKAGVNHIAYSDASSRLEPDSVVLRDPAGKNPLQILEQNFRADAVSEGLLLSLNEGKTIDFETHTQEGDHDKKEIIHGKIIRSGYNRLLGPSGAMQPVIEVDGKLMFRLPGLPLFPALADDSVLRPTLEWDLSSANSGQLDAELSYVTGGMSWHADYNLVAAEQGDTIDLVGWVTMDNQSGKSYSQASIKLMAGDVNKIQPAPVMARAAAGRGGAGGGGGLAGPPPVTEKTFDEYHLYTLQRATTLRDHESKQVEFVRATDVNSHPIYVYDGARIVPIRVYGPNADATRNNREYGVDSGTKVVVMREFVNAESNHLGMPLPKGRLRFYRRDADGQMEFTGENMIDHTPKDETIRVTTGDSFDLVGERKRTDYHVDANNHTLDETFAITLRNHKKEPVEIRAVEHLNRWENWEFREKSDDYVKTDSQTVEFRVKVAPNQNKVVTYSVHYWW